MDESWRKSMGISGPSVGGTALEPEDFDDVFGGPPRSVMARKLSADFSGNDWFYNEIFRPPSELDSATVTSGQRLPEFVIPGRRRSKNKQNSMSRSKSSSFSVMSLDELKELNNFGSAAVIGEEDVALSSYTSRLRPLNLPSRWTSSSPSVMQGNNHKKHNLPVFGCTNNAAYLENNMFTANEGNCYVTQTFNSDYPRTVPSPETINSKNTAFRMVNTGEYDTQFPENSATVPSYVSTEVNSQMIEETNSEAINLVEAIAWAKEKFQGWSSKNNAEGRLENKRAAISQK